MEFRSKKIAHNLDSLGGIAQSATLEATGRKVELKGGVGGVSGTGNGSDSVVRLGLVASPNRWRVVGIGGYVVAKGADQVQESMQWGYLVSDIGGVDADAFGSVVCVATANKEFEAGDIIYQGVSPFDDFFGFDALASAGAHVWLMDETSGAGVLAGDWQTKAAFLTATKINVADSTATIVPFMLIEYETGKGVV